MTVGLNRVRIESSRAPAFELRPVGSELRVPTSEGTDLWDPTPLWGGNFHPTSTPYFNSVGPDVLYFPGPV